MSTADANIHQSPERLNEPTLAAFKQNKLAFDTEAAKTFFDDGPDAVIEKHQTTLRTKRIEALYSAGKHAFGRVDISMLMANETAGACNALSKTTEAMALKASAEASNAVYKVAGSAEFQMSKMEHEERAAAAKAAAESQVNLKIEHCSHDMGNRLATIIEKAGCIIESSKTDATRIAALTMAEKEDQGELIKTLFSSLDAQDKRLQRERDLACLERLTNSFSDNTEIRAALVKKACEEEKSAPKKSAPEKSAPEKSTPKN